MLNVALETVDDCAQPKLQRLAEDKKVHSNFDLTELLTKLIELFFITVNSTRPDRVKFFWAQ
jgi:hypothetical protein